MSTGQRRRKRGRAVRDTEYPGRGTESGMHAPSIVFCTYRKIETGSDKVNPHRNLHSASYDNLVENDNFEVQRQRTI
jgi:hypothetical protein